MTPLPLSLQVVAPVPTRHNGGAVYVWAGWAAHLNGTDTTDGAASTDTDAYCGTSTTSTPATQGAGLHVRGKAAREG